MFRIYALIFSFSLIACQSAKIKSEASKTEIKTPTTASKKIFKDIQSHFDYLPGYGKKSFRCKIEESAFAETFFHSVSRLNPAKIKDAVKILEENNFEFQLSANQEGCSVDAPFWLQSQDPTLNEMANVIVSGTQKVLSAAFCRQLLPYYFHSPITNMGEGFRMKTDEKNYSFQHPENEYEAKLAKDFSRIELVAENGNSLNIDYEKNQLGNIAPVHIVANSEEETSEISDISYNFLNHDTPRSMLVRSYNQGKLTLDMAVHVSDCSVKF